MPNAECPLPSDKGDRQSFAEHLGSGNWQWPSGFWLLISLLALFAASKPILFDTMDPDCFWHLKVAEQLHRQGIGPIVDTLSFNSIKGPWTPYSWLAELEMKAIWDAGGFRAAIAVQSILQALFVVLLALCGRTLRRGNPLGIVLAVIVCLFFAMPYLSFRPVLLAIDLLALISWLTLRDSVNLASQKTIGWVVPLTVLLTNVHFFSILVPLIFVARIVGDWIARVDARRNMLLFAATFLAACATPMLPGVAGVIWHYQFTDAAVSHRLAAEFAPIYAGQAGWIAIGLLIFWSVATARSALRWNEKLWAFGFAVLLLRMGRFAPIFAPIGVATSAFVLPQFKSVVMERVSLRWAMVVVLAIGMMRLVFAFPPSQSFAVWLNRNGPDTPGYPTAAADYVAAHVPAGRLINEFSWGGYLEWRLGNEHPVFIDGRTQVFPPALWQQVAAGLPSIDFAGANAAILPKGNGGLHQSLIHAGWSTAYADDRAEVLVPPATVRAE